MRQFELYAIITQPIALVSVAACQVNGTTNSNKKHITLAL